MVDTTISGNSNLLGDRRRYARLNTAEAGGATTAPRFPNSVAREPHPVLDLEFDRLFGYVAQRKIWVGGALVIGVLAGLSFGIIVPARYTADTEILIDPAGLRVVSDDLYTDNDQRDALVLNVESKMRVLTSGNVVDRVISQLNLVDDPEFVPPEGWLPAMGTSAPPEETARRALQERVRAKRDEKSFVVTLSVTSQDGVKSVQIANAIVEAFRDDLVSSESLGAARAADALGERLDALRLAAAAADTAVEDFKRANNLQSSQGELTSTQSMTQVNAQVLEAQAKLFEMQARYERLIAGGDASVGAAAQESGTITALRTQYAAVKQQADSITATRGPLHPDVRAILPQVASLETQIAAETSRIVQAAKTDVEQAKAALSLLQSQADASRSTVATDNSAQVALRELEREAASSAAIYASFLDRTREIAEREQIDTTNIRVISAPAVPSKRSWPPSLAQLAMLGAAAGLALGALTALGFGLLNDRPRAPVARPQGVARRA